MGSERKGPPWICPPAALLAAPSQKAHCPWNCPHHDCTTADAGDAHCFRTSLNIPKMHPHTPLCYPQGSTEHQPHQCAAAPVRGRGSRRVANPPPPSMHPQGESLPSWKHKGWPRPLFLIRQNSCLRGNHFMDHLGLVLKPWQHSIIDQLFQLKPSASTEMFP